MTQSILSIRNIEKKYAAHTALDDVSLEIPKGQIYGLLGPNGAGKTSLIRIINQITAPDEGEVFFEGVPLNASHISQIGYLPEERGLYKKMKVGDLLIYLARLKGMSKDEAMERLKVWFVKFDIKSWWDKPVEDLSKGMQQKIQFVATVLHKPKLIILDEPFSGFDPINANIIKDEILQLKEEGSTIIFSTHRMESVEELCDHIALINKSKKVLDGPKLTLKQEFKDNTFEIQYKGDLTANPGLYEILSTTSLNNDEKSARIKLIKEDTLDDVLKEIIQTVSLRALKENIPSMNDIFIKAVSGSH